MKILPTLTFHTVHSSMPTLILKGQKFRDYESKEAKSSVYFKMNGIEYYCKNANTVKALLCQNTIIVCIT